jgi:class 3 adenylate cyclase
MSLAPRCPACGAESQADARFCIACGSSLVARPADAAGERKVVSIVFADLAGSTSLHERLDAESTRAFMDRYYRAMQGAVEAHGGTVTQLLGDGVKAVFGAPRVAEDDALRAVRAAVEMQRAFRALASGESRVVGELGLRVAVHTGEVVVKDEAEIIGDPVNVAARLQQEAREGDVLVGESTRRLVSELVTLAPFGTFSLKGRAEPVAAWRVVSLERPAGAPAIAFVGREDELRRLMAVYEAAVASPGARLAVVLGSPGLGKSRLLAELGRRLGNRATVLTAQCNAAGEGTFAPIATALRAWLGIDDGTTGDALRAAIAAAISGEDSERARIADGVAALLSGEPASPEETFFVVRRLLAARAAVRPVVLAIDDLQWAEPLLLDLVEHLAQWSRDAPLLVLAAARPELREARSSLAAPGALVADVLTLTGLDAAAATRLAANVIGADALPAAIAGRVLATSEGNPLFVGELVRMLVHDGVLKREGNRWTAGVEPAALEMPPTIQALLAARIERLRPEERSVLERAAVVGRHFSRTAVAQLLPPEISDLDARLESLRRSQLIEPDTGWLLGEPVLRFHHVLIRDAAYRRLLKHTRAELHGRFADWLESRAPDAVEHDETIGWHLEQAHRHLQELGPIDERGRALGERAARRLAAAGRRALARDDLPLAASLLGRALERLDPADPARADLALDACEALLAAGEVGAASAAIDELGRVAAGSERLRAWHTCFAGELAALTDPKALRATADAVATAAEALAVAGDAAGEAKAHSVHAIALSRLGQVGACESALDRALAAARRARDRRRVNTVLAGAPLAALWGPGPVARASGRCLDVVRVLRITQSAPGVEAVALRCQAVLEALRGRSEAARRMITSSRRMVEELGITQGLLETEFFAGLIELIEGDPAAAEQSLRAAYEGFRSHGLGIDAARAAALLGRPLLAQGRAAEAEALSHESEALAGDDLQAAITWRRVRAEALASRGEHAAAVDFARAAVEIAAATDALLHHADARLALAAALRAAGLRVEAAAEEARAVELWEAKGATLLAERARRDIGRVAEVDLAPVDRSEPARTVRRPVRANAATANVARLDAAIAARDADALPALFAHEMQTVNQQLPGGAYDRQGVLATWRSLLSAEAPACRHEPLATLGDSLVLCRQSLSASGFSGRRFDVGAYEREVFGLVEVDSDGRQQRAEHFAADKLGDAVARLYERYAELLPEGPERERAATTARSVAALLDLPDVDRWATAISPAVEFVDGRTLGLGRARGTEAAMRALCSLLEVASDSKYPVDDVLDLQPDALLVRQTNFGTDRAGGGTYERPFLAILVFGEDGLLARLEQFDADRHDAARARFDELLAAPPAPRPARRRVRPNAATADAARLDEVIAARDADALPTLYADEVECVDHVTGSTWDRQGALFSLRSLLRAGDPTSQHEPLATLGDSVALCRWSTSGSGFAGGTFDVGAYEREEIALIEVDAQGRRRRLELFAADRLGDAVARLYERYAELRPEGPERARVAATARSVSALLGPPDRWPFAPDVETTDHRTVGFGSLHGAEAVLGAIRALIQLSADCVYRIDDVVELRSDALFVRWTSSGTIRASGGAFERDLCQLWIFGADGLVARWEQFDAEQDAEALARFDELANEPPGPVRRRVRANAGSAMAARLNAAFASRDAGALPTLLAESAEFIDHTAHAEFDQRALLAAWRTLLSVDGPTYRLEPLATLGTSALCRRSVSGGGVARGEFDVGPYEIETISLIEVDAPERLARMELFAPDRLGDAVARLYERYAELLPAGPAHERAAATGRSVAALMAPPDVDRWATAISPAVEFVDRRTLGLGRARGTEAALRALRSLLEVASDSTHRVDDILDLKPEGLLMHDTSLGTDRAGGGTYERPFLCMWVFGDDGLLARLEQFDADRHDAARARFDELATEPPAVRHIRRRVRENAATAQAARLDGALAERDVDALPMLLAEDAEVVDHTTGASYGRSGTLDHYRRQLRTEDLRHRQEPLATLGDSLALCRLSVSGSGAAGRTFDVGAFEFDNVTLVEVDAQGQRRRLEVFAADHLGTAIARLYERYAELLPEGPERDRAAATARSVALLDQIADPDRWAAAIAPAVEFVDRRALGLLPPSSGREALVRMLRSLHEVARDLTLRIDDVLALHADAHLFRCTNLGTDRTGGGAFERQLLVLRVFGSEGLVTRYEFFGPECAAEALARFDELTAAAPAARFANAATRAGDRRSDAWAAGDWARFAAGFPPGFRVIDRRGIAQLEIDRDQYVESFRPLFEMASSITTEVLATRGDRLALSRTRWIGADSERGPSEVEFLRITEVDERGELALGVTFDPAALDAAYSELDARYAAGELADDPVAVERLNAVNGAFATRNWDALTAQLAPDLVVIDHRPLGWETIHGPAAYVATLKSLVDLAPDARLRTDHVRTSERGLLVVAMWVGTREGGAFEAPRAVVYELDASRRIGRWDVYDLDQLDAAWARFESIQADGQRDPLAALARPNAASAATDRAQAAFEARDWAALRATYRADARIEDRRRHAHTAYDVDSLVSDAQQLARSGVHYRSQLIASVGERVALERFLWSGDVPAGGGPFEVELLGLSEVDEAGRIVAAIRFDPEDWRVANREAWGRWLARDAAAAAVVGPAFEFIEGANDHDRARMRGVLADDLAFHDRRLTGEGRVDGADAYLDTLAVIWGLSPDTQAAPRFVLALERHGVVSVARTFGTLPEGGAWENWLVSVATVAGGRITRLELFELEAVDAALARLAELRPDPLQIPPNAATRAAHRWGEAIAAGDGESVEALLAPTLVFEDRRRGLLVTGDREMLLWNVRLLGSSRPRISHTVLATAGDRLKLSRVSFAGIARDEKVAAFEGVAFEVEFLELVEVDGDGRLVTVVAFDPDDRRAASAEMVERRARSDAADRLPPAAIEVLRGIRDHDLARCRAALPDAYVHDDHRRTGAGRLEGADAYIAWLATLFQHSPDAIYEPLYDIAVGSHGALLVAHIFGTLAGGGEFELAFVNLVRIEADRLVGVEVFEVDDLDLARARFEELRAAAAASC